MSTVEPARVDPSDLRLLAPAVVAWAVAAATLGSGWGTRVLVVAGSMLLSGVVAVLARRDPGGRARGLRGPLALCVVLLALLQTAAFGQGVVRERGGVRDLADERAVVVAEVVLTGDPVRVASRDGEARVLRDGTVQVLTGRGRARAASAPVLLTGGPALVGPGWRATVLVRGRLGPLDPADDRLATLAVSGPVRVLSPPGAVAGAAERLRSGLRAAVDDAPADARGLLPGLVIGDTSRTPPDLTEAMLATGMTHLTAVSGGKVKMGSFTRMVRKPLKAARRTRAERLWQRQGKPTDFPVIVRKGTLTACPHGIGLVDGFQFNLEYMAAPIGQGALWDRLSALYPVTRIAYMLHCKDCRAAAGHAEYPNLLNEWRP
ncbi:hypothetical protein G7075_04210 [Phycicoccus sp. HDW14]|uniref:hypothetical protein n=1 Tax=Phycicoccus sp. HDW14 TaxID=2714941 RepID=UPI0014089C04|nr:hypothetical protein [Phycicoccus sp. HDW14]QIM20523.1 hypothetical protein G7075_04210 [Phycicoccus sp. HDW14]